MIKQYQKREIPITVMKIIKSVCIDYDRRAFELKRDEIAEKTRETFLTLNTAIDAALESVEAGLRRGLFEDIKLGRGYNFSPCSAFICKTCYYSRKNKVIFIMAHNMNLIDGHETTE